MSETTPCVSLVVIEPALSEAEGNHMSGTQSAACRLAALSCHSEERSEEESGAWENAARSRFIRPSPHDSMPICCRVCQPAACLSLRKSINKTRHAAYPAPTFFRDKQSVPKEDNQTLRRLAGNAGCGDLCPATPWLPQPS